MTEDTIHFPVRSSSTDEIYSVTAELKPSLRITCSCQAGLLGSICKHRMGLLLGDVTSVVEVDAGDVDRLSTVAAASPLGAAMRELDGLEKEFDRMKKAVAAKKKHIARMLNG